MNNCTWLKGGQCEKSTQCKVEIVRFTKEVNKTICVNVTPPMHSHDICWAYISDEDCSQLGLKEKENEE